MVAEAIVRLAESNRDILFKDTFGQPYAEECSLKRFISFL